MSFELHLLWLPWYTISCLAFVLTYEIAIKRKLRLNLTTVLSQFLLQIFHVINGLLVLFLKLLTLFFKVDYLFLQPSNGDPLSLQDFLEERSRRGRFFEVLIVVKSCLLREDLSRFFVVFSEHILLYCEFEIVFLLT